MPVSNRTRGLLRVAKKATLEWIDIFTTLSGVTQQQKRDGKTE